MSKKPNRTCAICGTEFYGCDNCYEFKTFYPWKMICDTQQHYQVYQIFSMYRGKVINKFEVKEALNKIGVGINEIKTFILDVQEVLLPIMETKVEEVVEVVSEVTFEDTETVDEEPTYRKSTKKK